MKVSIRLSMMFASTLIALAFCTSAVYACTAYQGARSSELVAKQGENRISTEDKIQNLHRKQRKLQKRLAGVELALKKETEVMQNKCKHEWTVYGDIAGPTHDECDKCGKIKYRHDK